jgi:hypothetical protein
VSPAGDTDATIRGLTRTGQVDWSPTFSTAGQDAATAVAAGGGKVFVVGTTTGDTTTPTAGGIDGFLETLDGHGVSGVKQTFGGAGDDEPSSVTLADAVYVGGSTSGSIFDQPAFGEEDGFVSRFVRSGVQVWTEQIGTTDYDRAYGLAVDTRGAYLVGTTHGAFDGLTNAGDRDVFVASVRFT